jgi:TP901 family phage tail tape measure protein
MSAGAIRAGGVFVEIGADPRKFFSALNKVNKSLGNMGRSLVSGGGRLAAAGIGMAAPIAAAVQQGAAFESTLLNIRASTGATAAQIDQIKASSMAMSQALGVGPTEAAKGMLELLKAGMELDAVLGGAGKTAMEFAKVGEMDVAQAAVVMSDAMNVFKVSSDVAANALSSAADASSTSIAQMSEAFSMSSAVAGLAGQSIEDLSATLAILANNGVKGSDAGTSVKTMLMRLMAPADDAVGALNQLGLSVASFRGADGQMKPMVEIIGTLNQAMGGLDQTAKDDIFRRIFGADAIRAASILASEGVNGFTEMRDAMADALPVGEKYKMMMSGLSGSFGSALAAMQRLAITITDALSPALASVGPFITGFINGLTKLAGDNKEAVAQFAKFTVVAVGLGVAMSGVGLALQAASFGFSVVGSAVMLALSPITLMISGINNVGRSFTLVMPQTLALLNRLGSGLVSASAAVVSFAADAIRAAATLSVAIASAMLSSLASVAAFAGGSIAAFAAYLGAAASAVVGSVSAAAAVAAAWLAPLAPLLLLSAAAVGVGVAVKQFQPQITSAFSDLTGYVNEAGGAISGGFSTAVSDGIVVLGDLATTATTTFNGVYEAVAAGDLSGAMDVLWAGLVAGWLRGTEALMSYVDPWVAAFQDVFTDIGAGIYIAWDKIYTDSSAILNTMGAFIMGFFDNIANGVMATFDNLVAAIQIAWTRVQGYITGAKDTEQRVQAIKDENAARAEQRMQERPGVNARTDKAAAENAKAEADRQDRKQAALDAAEETKGDRQAANDQRAADRRAATAAAEGNLASVTTGASEGRKDAVIAAELLKSLGTASSLDEITNIGASMDALIQRGNVSGEMEAKLLDAYYAAFSRVNVDSASASSEKAATAGAGAAGSDSAMSKGEVAGTFSSLNLGSVFGGSSLAERTAKAAEETAKNTRKIDDGGKVAA